jgi:iron/manganese superoxide dismutase-like protein
VGLEKTLAFNLSGHVLHSIFWRNLSPDGGDRPDGDLAEAITGNFGSFEAFRARLSAATTGVQGSGWGVLGYEPVAGRLIIEQVYDHHGNVGVGTVPLLVFDAWEHAYYLAVPQRPPRPRHQALGPGQLGRCRQPLPGRQGRRRHVPAGVMTGDPVAAFRTAAQAAQTAAGIIAARHRGDLASADALLDDLSDARKAAGFLFLADLAITLPAQSPLPAGVGSLPRCLRLVHGVQRSDRPWPVRSCASSEIADQTGSTAGARSAPRDVTTPRR